MSEKDNFGILIASSLITKEGALRALLFYSDLLILLHKSWKEGELLLHNINEGEEKRDSLILKTELTFEIVDVLWILKEKDVKEKLEKMKELKVLLNKGLLNAIVDKDFSMLGELFEKFGPLFTSIFGKHLNYEKYEKDKDLEWIESRLKENDKRKAEIDQYDNIEFFLNITNQNLKKFTYFAFTIYCEVCKKTYKIIAKLDPDEYIGDYFGWGYLGFPKDNKVNCKCGHVIVLSNTRNQIEKATGKKMVFDFRDDLKFSPVITLEISCPICGRENALYGQFFHSSRIDKDFIKKGFRKIPKNKIHTCNCGLFKWDLKNEIKKTEQETGMTLKY
ncbi:MAG: hypothetical protein ACFFD2_10215 [Promethearchaeota archaeon]